MGIEIVTLDQRVQRAPTAQSGASNKGGAPAQSVDTWVSDDSALFREGLLRVLSDTPFEVSQELSELKTAVELMGSEPNPALLLVSCQEGEALEFKLIRDLRASAPEMKIVALLRHMPVTRLSAAFESGVDAVLSSSISFKGLIDSLFLVMKGEKVMRGGPGPFLRSDGEARTQEDVPNKAVGKLTRREEQVLRALASGESNKAIAKRFGITEATAKVHMRRLFKKTKASNRTQAAIWAIKHGISLEENSP